MSKAILRARDGYTYAGELDLVVMTCPDCGITYAIPERLRANAYSRSNRQIVWQCPNGHELGYNGESDEDRAKLEAERERTRAARLRAILDQTEAALRAQKARGTRFKNDRDRGRRRVPVLQPNVQAARAPHGQPAPGLPPGRRRMTPPGQSDSRAGGGAGMTRAPEKRAPRYEAVILVRIDDMSGMTTVGQWSDRFELSAAATTSEMMAKALVAAAEILSQEG